MKPDYGVWKPCEALQGQNNDPVNEQIRYLIGGLFYLRYFFNRVGRMIFSDLSKLVRFKPQHDSDVSWQKYRKVY